ncbi:MULTISPECIES: hypothetical protein [unclassified Bradyrhizobium]|nr:MULTISPECIES: hypothetical protein [unclassified Bradyrhizobium]
MTEPSTAPFAPFEWMLSARYLRARRRDGFISRAARLDPVEALRR